MNDLNSYGGHNHAKANSTNTYDQIDDDNISNGNSIFDGEENGDEVRETRDRT